MEKDKEPWVCVDCGKIAPLAPGIGYFCENKKCPAGKGGLHSLFHPHKSYDAEWFAPKSEWEARRKLIAQGESDASGAA